MEQRVATTPLPDGVEERRQRTIRDYQLDSPGSESEFNAVSELAADLFDVPISLVTVLGPDMQMFRGACGVDGAGTSRSDAFCNLTVEGDDVVVVEDAAADDRFAANPLVTGAPHIRFYAGAPLVVGGGVAVGSLCLIDQRPRTLTPAESHRLKLMARTVTDLMELRIGSRLAEARQRELGDQAELLRATIDNVRQGIGVFDAGLRLVLWNELLFDLLGLPARFRQSGCTAEELLLDCAERGAFGPGDPQGITDGLIESIRTTPNRQIELAGPDGRTLSAWRATIPGGRSILTIEDVTEQRRVARMKNEFVSTVSHELRTPLTSIRGALAILGRKAGDSLDPQSTQMLNMAIKNSERLTALINDILDIEKIGSGTLAMRRDPVDLAQVLDDSVEQNRPYALSLGVELELVLGGKPIGVLGDHGRLLQAVTNLLSNACKFSPRGATVTLTGECRDGLARVSVEDRGSGIPADFRPHIFRRFSQADPASRAGAVGTGLGLAITKAIVERHDGEIGFESEPGQGTCFWFRLPLTGAGQ